MMFPSTDYIYMSFNIKKQTYMSFNTKYNIYISCNSTIWRLCFHKWYLQDAFPIRNTSLKQWVAHVLKLQSLDSENEGSDSDDNSKPCLRPLTFPKAHGMAAHVWSKPLMYGGMQNVSAQIIDNMHLKVQDTAAHRNGQDGWELQPMIRHCIHPHYVTGQACKLMSC